MGVYTCPVGYGYRIKCLPYSSVEGKEGIVLHQNFIWLQSNIRFPYSNVEGKRNWHYPEILSKLFSNYILEVHTSGKCCTRG